MPEKRERRARFHAQMRTSVGNRWQHRELRSESSGFTLIELVTVIVILGFLVLIAMFAFRKYLYKAEVITAVADIGAIEKIIYGYTIDFQGALPPNLAAVNYGGFEDPWGNPYVYQPDLTISPRTKGGGNINTDYDLYSIGRDGLSPAEITLPGSLDDIIRASDGNYKGLADRY